MKIELIEMYPMYGEVGKSLNLSAHIYLIDFGIDIRGIKVRVDPNGVTVFDPTERAIDYVDRKKLVVYPVFKFMNEDLRGAIMPLISEMALKMYRDPYTFDRIEKTYLAYQTEIFRLANEQVKVKHKNASKKAKGPQKPKVAKPPKEAKSKKTPTAKLTPYTPRPRPPITGFKPLPRTK